MEGMKLVMEISNTDKHPKKCSLQGSSRQSGRGSVRIHKPHVRAKIGQPSALLHIMLMCKRAQHPVLHHDQLQFEHTQSQASARVCENQVYLGRVGWRWQRSIHPSVWKWKELNFDLWDRQTEHEIKQWHAGLKPAFLQKYRTAWLLFLILSVPQVDSKTFPLLFLPITGAVLRPSNSAILALTFRSW